MALLRSLFFLCLLLHKKAFAQHAITTDQNLERTNWQGAQNIWIRNNLPNYIYDLVKERDVCCWTNTFSTLNYPHTVQINTDNAVERVTALDSKGSPVTSVTIDSFFGEIGAALNNPNMLVQATYDPTYGYPTNFYIQTGAWPNPTNFDTTRVSGFTRLTSSQAGLFITARNTWFNQRNYNYNYIIYNMGSNTQNLAQPVNVVVRNNQIDSAYDANNNRINLNNLNVAYPWTIDQWMDHIERQINTQAPFIENTYNPTYGYPATTHMVMNGVYGTNETTISSFALA